MVQRGIAPLPLRRVIMNAIGGSSRPIAVVVYCKWRPAACFSRCLHHVTAAPSSVLTHHRHGAAVLSQVRTASTSSTSDANESDRKWKLLYHRSKSRNTSPRAICGFSGLNLCYWSWYTIDFVPAINSAAHAKAALGQIDAETLELMCMDPKFGYVGLAISSIMSLGAFLYSRQLVSAIWASEDHALAVSTLKLPLLAQPKILDRLVYDPETNKFDGSVEDVVFDDSEIKSESSIDISEPGELALSEDKMKHDVLVKFEGDFSKLRGHIALKKEGPSEESDGSFVASLLQQKYLLDISSADELLPSSSPILLESLVVRDIHFQEGDAGRYKMEAGAKRGGKRSPSNEKSRPVTQVELARGAIKQSVKRRGGFGKKKGQ